MNEHEISYTDETGTRHTFEVYTNDGTDRLSYLLDGTQIQWYETPDRDDCNALIAAWKTPDRDDQP